MLIPNLKFFVLPLIAVAVIAFLPASGTGELLVETRTIVAPAPRGADCEQMPRPCTVAMQLSTTLVR